MSNRERRWRSFLLVALAIHIVNIINAVNIINIVNAINIIHAPVNALMR